MDLDAIEAAEKAMTAAPWKVVPSNEKANSCRIFGDKYIGVLGGSDDPKNEVEANATGIALLRNSTPEMVARIREQDAEIERLRALCGVVEEEYQLFKSLSKKTRDGLLAASKGEK